MPASHDLPDAVRRLLEEHVDTFEKLEIVKLPRKHAGRAWSEGLDQQAPALDDALTADALGELCNSRFVRGSTAQLATYSFAPEAPQLAAAVEALAQELVLPRTDADAFRVGPGGCARS